VPVLLAAYAATTRYSDYRHHGVDIIFGSLLGVGTAVLGWTWYGPRSINGARGFGSFIRCDDLELGQQQTAITGQDTYFDTQAKLPPGGERGAAKGDNSTEAPGQLGNTTEGESKGALQLREMSLSISTLDGPEDVNQRKSAENPAQDHSPEAFNPGSSQEGAVIRLKKEKTIPRT